METSEPSLRVQSTPQWLVERLPDLLLISALLIASLRFIAPVQQLTDILLYDESDYLAYGATLLQNGLPTPDWAPLYAVWYFGLSLIQPDRIDLYFLNFQLLCLLLPLVLYVTLRRYATPPLLAALCAFLFLIARANLPMWPRVSHFALLIVLGSLIAASFARSRTSAFAIAGFGALLAAYARPDLALAALLLALVVGITLLRNSAERQAANWPLLGGLSLAGLGLMLWLGPPVGDGYRSFAAFAQHFGLNWVRWTGSPLSPWTNPFEIIALAFGDVQSVGGALRADPGLFARHVFSNLARAPQAFFELFFFHANLLLPPARQALEGWLILLLSVSSALIVGWRRREQLGGRIRTLTPLWIILGSYLPGLLIANLVIYPRKHYLLILGVLLLIGIMALFGRPGNTRTSAPLLLTLALAAAIAIFTPPATAVLPAAQTKPTLATVDFIAALPIDGPVYMLEAEGGYNIYLGDRFSRVAEYAKDAPFNQWADERRINMIVVSPTLRNYSRLRDDPEWQALLNDPAAQGFVPLPITGTDRLLLVQQSLLEP